MTRRVINLTFHFYYWKNVSSLVDWYSSTDSYDLNEYEMNYKLDLQWRCNKTYLVGRGGKRIILQGKNSIFLVNNKGDFHVDGDLLGTLKKERVEFCKLSSFSREYKDNLTKRCCVGCRSFPSNCLHTKDNVLSNLPLSKWSPIAGAPNLGDLMPDDLR